eukprot:scaffold110001_cov63-Phaeocystis_antarctica.AAC.2
MTEIQSPARGKYSISPDQGLITRDHSVADISLIYQADTVVVLVSADVVGLRDAAAFRCVAAVDGAGGGGGPRPLGGGRPACAMRA